MALIGNCIGTKILEKMKISNYYSLIVDYTPDFQELMSMKIQYIDVDRIN